MARTCLPANAPETDLNLFGLLRRYVGKDLSKARTRAAQCPAVACTPLITQRHTWLVAWLTAWYTDQVSMPVSLNEPLSMLQRICEELEYASLLDHVRPRSSMGAGPRPGAV